MGNDALRRQPITSPGSQAPSASNRNASRELREPMGGRASGSMLACRRACCLYLNRSGFARITQTHLTCRGHSRCALLHQNSSNMGDNNPVNQEVEQFNRRSLKKTETHVKDHLPTKEEIEQEKKAMKEEK